MARITVEDCLLHTNNRFDLVLEAAKRTRELEKGAEALIEWDNNKPTIVALREIAAGLHDPFSEAKPKDQLFAKEVEHQANKDQAEITEKANE